ncbi:MAG: energy-coupled thiamine transporter ThiT, partial [Clostridia bacterium]|nr:energy-coupled thiamine transporter ThiT [Clostridia bacterium]
MKNTRILAEMAITVALSCVLYFVRLWTMPQGGCVSLEMVPILILAYRRGAKEATVAGAVYGVISIIFEG